jgi:hypothetical protein
MIPFPIQELADDLKEKKRKKERKKRFYCLVLLGIVVMGEWLSAHLFRV